MTVQLYKLHSALSWVAKFASGHNAMKLNREGTLQFQAAAFTNWSVPETDGILQAKQIPGWILLYPESKSKTVV